MVLIDRDLWGIVNGDEVKPAAGEKELLAAFTKRDNQALAQIILTLSNAQLVHVRNAKSSHDAWTNICSAFQAKGLAAKVYLRRQFFTIKFQDGSSMQDHLNKVRDLADQLAEMEAGVSDQDLAMTALCSLSDRFDSLIVSLESRSSQDLTSDFVFNRLLAEERRQLESIQSNDVAPSAHQARVSSIKCSFCSKPNHTEAKCYKKHGFPVGHPRHVKKESAQAASSNIPNNTIVMNYSAVSACCLTSASASASTSSTLDWLIDSGASTHICSQRSSFSSLRPLDQPVLINIADGRAIRAISIGDISLDVLCDGSWFSMVIRNVLFAPELKMNLISVSRLTADGMVVSFFDNQCRITKLDRIIASSFKEASDLYRLTSRINNRVSAGVSSINSESKLWHARLGHLHADAMLKLINKRMADGLPSLTSSLDLGVCEGCALGKSHRVAMPHRATSRATKLLELVHSDICGPIQVNSLGGKRYFITFVDDYSRSIVVRTIAKRARRLRHSSYSKLGLRISQVSASRLFAPMVVVSTTLDNLTSCCSNMESLGNELHLTLLNTMVLLSEQIAP